MGGVDFKKFIVQSNSNNKIIPLKIINNKKKSQL